MPYVSNHRQGGLRAAYWIECHTCGTTSPSQPTPEQAWDWVRQAGWHRDPSYPLKPRCPQCAASLLAA